MALISSPIDEPIDNGMAINPNNNTTINATPMGNNTSPRINQSEELFIPIKLNNSNVLSNLNSMVVGVKR